MATSSSVLRQLLLVITVSLCISSVHSSPVDSIIEHSQSYDGGLCLNLIEPCGYTCLEHTVSILSPFPFLILYILLNSVTEIPELV